jgi:hypothetical protein
MGELLTSSLDLEMGKLGFKHFFPDPRGNSLSSFYWLILPILIAAIVNPNPHCVITISKATACG